MNKTKKGLFLYFGCIMLAITTVFASSDITAAGIEEVDICEEGYVYLGGDATGVKLYTGGIIVVGLSDVVTENGEISPAKNAGIKVGDIITEIESKAPQSAEQFKKIIENSGGKKFAVRYKRGGTFFETKILPAKSKDGEYKCGMWIRDSCAGIGTVSYVTADGVFASLGHGICDIDTGVLMPISKGNSVKIEINGVNKGKANSPGELKGVFSSEKTGYLVSNTQVGLFGVFDSEYYKNRKIIKVGSGDDVHIGKAQIISTVDESGPQYFDIEIEKILSKDDEAKNFTIRICDDKLIEATGGIVQGMSGSPVIQDGKLIGAVTHVTVNNPETGYGIFIGNMLYNTPNVK